MLLNRGLLLLRSYNALKARKSPATCMNFTRQSSGQWYYRTNGRPTKGIEISAEIVMAFGWWWVLWHVFTEPGHIFGEFDYPNPREWTDEELGIPSE